MGFKLSLNNNKSVTLGRATYTPQQIQIVGQKVLELEQYKLMQCSLLEVALKTTPPPSYANIEHLLSTIAAYNIEILNIGKKIAASNDPQDVINSINKNNEIPYEINFPSSEYQKLTSLNEKLNYQTRTIDSVKMQLNSIQETLSKSFTIEKSSDIKFTISGFSPNSSRINTEMRDSITESLSTLVTTKVANNVVFVDVIGFSDSTGSYQNNVRLGLDRAATVSTYISNFKNMGRLVSRTIASGGISKNTGEDGRKVEVYLTVVQQ